MVAPVMTRSLSRLISSDPQLPEIQLKPDSEDLDESEMEEGVLAVAKVRRSAINKYLKIK